MRKLDQKYCNLIQYDEKTYGHVQSLARYEGYGNSFFGEGGRGNKRAQLRMTLRAIRAIVATGEEAVHSDLCDQDIISILSGLLDF